MNINIKNASIEELSEELKLRQKELETQKEAEKEAKRKETEAKRQERQALLEEEFENAAYEAMTQIIVKMKHAQKSIEEAEAISEKYGIPFSTWCAGEGFFRDIAADTCRSKYTPESYEKKFGKMDLEFIWGYDDSLQENAPGEYEGWQHSRVC